MTMTNALKENTTLQSFRPDIKYATVVVVTKALEQVCENAYERCDRIVRK